jgi:hypothetical protein
VEVCFAASTPVRMGDGGWKRIEEIRPGDRVMSACDARPEDDSEAKPVVEVYRNQPRRLLTIEIENVAGSDAEVGMIRATESHPFYVRDRGWTPANQLSPGDRLLGHDGRWRAVVRTTLGDQPEPVFNLQVADHHTYFVGTGAGDASALVHNVCDFSEMPAYGPTNPQSHPLGGSGYPRLAPDGGVLLHVQFLDTHTPTDPTRNPECGPEGTIIGYGPMKIIGASMVFITDKNTAGFYEADRAASPPGTPIIQDTGSWEDMVTQLEKVPDRSLLAIYLDGHGNENGISTATNAMLMPENMTNAQAQLIASKLQVGGVFVLLGCATAANPNRISKWPNKLGVPVVGNTGTTHSDLSGDGPWIRVPPKRGWLLTPF